MADAIHTSLKTTGMHCRSCVALVEMNVGDLEGVLSVEADLAKGLTSVDFDPDVTDVASIVAEIEKAGYRVEPVDDR